MKPPLLFLMFLVFSCSFFNMSPLVVRNWSPVQNIVEADEDISISVTFSRPLKRMQAENAFSLRGQGLTIPGQFIWDDEQTLRYLPAESLNPKLRYELTVSTQCEDIYGNNLQTPFSHWFSSADDKVRPAIISFMPMDGLVSDNRYLPIEVLFSESMERDSLYKAFSLSPMHPGTFEVITPEDCGSRIVFTPYYPYPWQEEVIVSVSREAKDESGNTLGEDFSFRFCIGTDNTPPEIDRVQGGECLSLVSEDDDPPVLNRGWEAGWNMEIFFSEKVVLPVLLNHVSLIPPVTFDVEERGEDCTEKVTMIFQDRLLFGTTYQLKITDGYEDNSGNTGSGGTWTFLVDGPFSTPPAVTGLNYLRDPGNNPGSITPLYQIDGSGEVLTELDIDLSLFGQPYTSGETGFFDLYIDLAQKENENLNSILLNIIDCFRIQTGNGCAGISLLSIDLSPEDPDPPPGPSQIVARIYARIENYLPSGVIEFSLNGDFTDSFGNPVAGEWTRRYNK